MKKFLFSLLCLLSTTSVTAGNVPAVYSSKPLRIDGKLDEAAWHSAPVINNFTRPDGKPLERRTEARIIFTPQAVVIGFKAFVPKSELHIVHTERDRATCSIDCVEVMLDCAGNGDGYKHIIVNAGNGVFDRICEQGGFVGDEKFNGEFTSAVQVYDDHWSCELRIPYRTLGIPENGTHRWKINLCRESFGSPTAPREISSICNGAFNVAGDFLTLQVPENVDLEQYKLDCGTIPVSGRISGKNMVLSISPVIRDLSGRSRDLRVEILIPRPGSQPVRKEERFALGAKASITPDFSGLVLNEPGTYTGMLTVRDHATNRIILRREFPVDARYVPIRIDLTVPWYRNTVFATQKLEKVIFDASLDLPPEKRQGKVTGGIRMGEQIIVSAGAEMDDSGKVHFEFPVSALPDGKMSIFVRFGEDEATVYLRKLPYKAGEVWHGCDGNWYKDGKKIFILSGWNYMHDYNEFYNIVTCDPIPGREVFFYNIHTFLGMGRIRGDLIQGKITQNVLDFYRSGVEKFKDHPLLFGHFLCDEPDIAGYTQESFARIAAFIEELDPYHPIMISPGSTGLIDFAASAEISGFHCYPKVERDRENANFDKIVYFMDRAAVHFANTGIRPTVTFLHQGFDYSDSGNTDTRVPTYEEFRNQNILALILGAKGLMHYNRGVDNFPELYLGMPHLTREQQVIGNEAVIQDDSPEKVTGLDPHLRILAKYNPQTQEYWVLVCNTSYESGQYAFTFAPFAGKDIQVLSENRTVSGGNGEIKEYFTPYQVHVYTTSARDFGLTAIADIKAQIAAVYTQRRAENQDNLAYQEHDDQRVYVSASSNKFMIFRAENSLWHLTDGVIGRPGEKPAVSPTSTGICVWQDNTPGALPDWAQLTFRQAVTVGRVEVYPADDSLKDYEIQILQNGSFVTVASVKDASGDKQTVTFDAVTATAVRLLVTGNRGAYSKVYEIKVFAR